jgi:hypothetical protein
MTASGFGSPEPTKFELLSSFSYHGSVHEDPDGRRALATIHATSCLLRQN